MAAITSTRESGSSRCLEARALAIDVDVDVMAQHGAGLAQPVAEARPAFVEPLDRLVHARCVDLEPPRQLGEQGRQRGGQVQVGHGYASTATSTDEIAGR